MIENRLKDIAITFICIAAAYLIYINQFLNADVTWHIEGAKRLLAGGDYLKNVFDDNSPFVFSYYIPLIWLSKVIPLSYPHLAPLYILATSLIPLILSYKLIHKAFGEKERVVRKLLYYAVLYIILFLPDANLGHREIVLIYFYLPYFLLIMFSTTYPNTFRPSKKIAFLTAILATFGICQNIFYLSVPIFVDIYKYLKIRQFKSYQLFFYIFVLFSVFIVFTVYPNYVRYIIPMVLCYESGFNFPVEVLLLEILTFMSLLTLFTVLLNIRRLYKSDDIILCFIAAVCSLLIYFFELKSWYYHLYPGLCFVILTLILLITKFYEENFLELYISPRVSLFSASIATGILSLIVLINLNSYRLEWTIFHNPKDEANRWIQYGREHFANKRVFVIAMRLGVPYFLSFYSNGTIEVVSPWSNPWVLPYFIIHQNNNHKIFCSIPKDIKLFQRIASNAIANKPDFIVIEIVNKSLNLFYYREPFDYVSFFSKDKNFRDLMKKYCFYGNYQQEFAIYKKCEAK
jgi:hypothetical protein